MSPTDIHLAGDYQTSQRMAQKLEAIVLPDLTGKTVLDVGCDHGAWSKLASDRGAKRVLGLDRGREVRGPGFVDLPKRNAEQGWPRCEFGYANLGKEWPEFGRYDVVLFFSVYHHVFQETGLHLPIWDWLWNHTAPGGLLIFEGPISTRDPIARSRAKGHKIPYDRASILAAAERYYVIESTGPAIHRPHREVWHCRARSEPDRDGPLGRGNGGPGLHGDADGGAAEAVRDAPDAGDAQREGAEREARRRAARAARRRDRARDQDRAAPVVEDVDVDGEDGPRAESRRAWAPYVDFLPGGRGSDSVPGLGSEGRRPYPPDPTLALICGGASCIWEDIAALRELWGEGVWPGWIIAVNDIGCHLPYVDHWASLHPEKFQQWHAERTGVYGLRVTAETWARRGQYTDHVVARKVNGSSGLFGGYVAIEVAGMEARGVYVGTPMTRTPHYHESQVHVKGRNWASADAHFRAWKNGETLELIDGRLKSMSGRTRELLGAPSTAWLHGESE